MYIGVNNEDLTSVNSLEFPAALFIRRLFYPPSLWRDGRLAGLPAVRLEGLPAVRLAGLVPHFIQLQEDSYRKMRVAGLHCNKNVIIN